MTLPEAMDMAWDIMKGNNTLNINFVERGWYFAFDKSRTRFGACFYNHKVIKLSKHLTLKNERSEVRDTILHELAHAIAGKEHGHDDVWKLFCVQLGCKPKRCYNTTEVESAYLWIARCRTCNHVYGRNRRTRKRTACSYCCNAFNYGKFDSKYELTYYRNEN